MDIDKLKQRLANRYIIDPATNCWNWNSIGSNGYGQLTFENKHHQAHRASYLAFVGVIPKGMFVLHRCDVPSCINPNHLFLGTQSDNIKDMYSKGRFKRKQFRGETSPAAKLKEIDVVAIRKSDLNTKTLSELFGVTTRSISQIRARETWKHI